MITIKLPTSITLPRKTKKDRKIALNKNIERVLHYRTYVAIKHIFTEILRETLKDQVIELKPPCHFHYQYFHSTKHLGDLDNCTGILKKFIQDSLVELGYLSEDNWNFIPSSSEEFGGYSLKDGYCLLTITNL